MPSDPSSNLNNDRLELALRASNEGIWDWIVAEKNIFYSRRILEFLECSPSSAPNIFLPPHLPVHHLDRPDFVAALDQALYPNGPETLAIDARIQTGGNNWRWLRIRGTVIRNRKGIATRIAGSMIDISRRKNAEAQIDEERHLLRSLIDHVPLQIYFKDLQSRFVMINRGMADYHGFSSTEELIGKHDKDLFSNFHWEKADADEKHIIQTGIPMTGQLERETWRQGGEKFVLTSKFPWLDKHGTIKGTFGVSSDVTSLVLAQRQATELADELQRKNTTYEEELKLAREIQQALATNEYPTATSSNGNSISFASRYLPISGLAGDFFEIIHLGNDKYGIFICDVMGHGIRAALVVSMLRGLLASQVAAKQNPSQFLQKLNHGLNSIFKHADVTMFATAFYGIIDLNSLSMTYSCAGHPGAVIIGSKNFQLCTQRSEKGPALGLIPDVKYPNHSVNLSDASKILLFTDGVLEAENTEGEMFLEKRLLNLASNNLSENLPSWLDNIIRSVLDFSQSNHFDDDVCLLGVQLKRNS